MAGDLLTFFAEHLRPGAIDLSASSPPPAVIEALPGEQLSAEQLAFVPPSGAPELREAIAARYETLGADDILLCAGASEALVAVALALLEPGGCAWSQPGTYPSFSEAARGRGAEIVESSAPPASASVALATNPAVPLGDLIDGEAWLRAAHDCGAVAVFDEVYLDLAFGCRRPVYGADRSPGAVSISDLSKPLGLAGLRIGWIATRDEGVRAKLDRQLQLLSGGPSSLGVAAALDALRVYDREVAATIACARRNAPELVRRLAARGWRVVLPDAGVTATIFPPAEIPLARLRQVEDAGFFLLPTDVFGLPGGFRICLLREPRVVERALSLLEGQEPAS